MNTPHVAAIIATSNRPELLARRSLASLLQQSLPPKYLIVVDDSTQTETRHQNKDIVLSTQCHGCHIQYLVNERTTGASGAWNTAVEYLSRTLTDMENLYIAILDDDDEWKSHYLESCLLMASQHNCDMVASGFYRIEDLSHPPVTCIPPRTLKEDSFLRGNPGIQGSNLFLRLSTMLAAGGFDEHLTSCTDRDLCIRIAEMGNVTYQSIPQPLMVHYAEDNRQRLSTPKSCAKTNGLNAFWTKYHGRMNTDQQTDFCDRAQSLFNWQRPDNQSPIQNPEDKLSLTLGLLFSKGQCSEYLQFLMLLLKRYQEQLVGFNIIVVQDDESTPTKQEVEAFCQKLISLSINCYSIPLSALPSCANDHTSHIDCSSWSKLRLVTAQLIEEHEGSRAWLFNAPPLKSFNTLDILLLLQRSGAIELPEGDAKQSLEALPPSHQKQLEEIITHCRIGLAKQRIHRLFDVTNLVLLGIGSEAVVLTDNRLVYKCIDYWKTRFPKVHLAFLHENGKSWNGLPGLYGLEDIIADGTSMVLTYPYEQSAPYRGGQAKLISSLIQSCSKAGIVCNNIYPKNLIVTADEVKLIDYGSDIKPWNSLGFEHMVRRAYLSIHHAQTPNLKELMQTSLSNIDLPEFQGYQEFRQTFVGFDRNLLVEKNRSLNMQPASHQTAPYHLYIGVISSDPLKLKPLLQSRTLIKKNKSLLGLTTLVLCNGCKPEDIHAQLSRDITTAGRVIVVSEAQQQHDARRGLFGDYYNHRPNGTVGIAHARSMVQKYIGLECEKDKNSVGWILDDDMRLDGRANQYLEWLDSFKKNGVDIVLGQFEGSSPNPPLNGLRGQLVDLVHNLKWLEQLPPNALLPDRRADNEVLRAQYPDYYYDLSRKHTAHLEMPHWIEPEYKGETVREARARLIAYAPLTVTGYPLTRSICPVSVQDPVESAVPSVNRGGNTFVLNHRALTATPNLIPIINGREGRRSDMAWAIANKHYRRMTIKAAAFPIVHEGRVSKEKTLNLGKVIDEIVGSALYAGLQEFLKDRADHKLLFTKQEIQDIWYLVVQARKKRLDRLVLSFHRISGITQALKTITKHQMDDLIAYLESSFTQHTFAHIKKGALDMDMSHIEIFLHNFAPNIDDFASGKVDGTFVEANTA